MAEHAHTWDRTEFEALLSEGKAKGYKKKELAELLGVSPPTLSDWVSGKHVPHATFQARFPELRKKLRDRRGSGASGGNATGGSSARKSPPRSRPS